MITKRNNLLCKCAFTLAEILIVISIIGVVADMTIPTMISNYQKKETCVKVQKFYSILSQAVQLSEIDNGSVQDWTIKSSIDGSSSTIFFNTYLANYFKISKNCGNTPQDCFTEKIKNLDGTLASAESYKKNYVKLPDGSSISVHSVEGLAVVVYDINGPAKPNRRGRDIFEFDIYAMPNYKYPVMPRYFGRSRAELVATNGRCASDKTGDGWGCAMLLMIDGWVVKEDYPW